MDLNKFIEDLKKLLQGEVHIKTKMKKLWTYLDTLDSVIIKEDNKKIIANMFMSRIMDDYTSSLSVDLMIDANTFKNTRPKRIIGITGGIACGKSTFVEMIRKKRCLCNRCR